MTSNLLSLVKTDSVLSCLQTVASQLRITNARMQQIQKQLNIQSKMISKFENDKKQMEIDHLKALLAAKQGSTKSETKGSVRARSR